MIMRSRTGLLLGVFAATVGGAIVAGAAQQKAPGLTAADRDQIQALTASYARTLGTCQAEAWADLYAAHDGYFASGFRGEVKGRDKLIALVQSEPQCIKSGPRTPRDVAVAVVEPSPEGARGRVPIGTAAYYQDVYVKTPQGWRFKSRHAITAREDAAHLDAQGFIEVRRLAGNDTGQFDDVYSNGPEGRHFRSAGVVIVPSPEGATGRAFLKNDGGRYDDVYVRTAQGWRFQSRTYVPPGAGSTAPGR